MTPIIMGRFVGGTMKVTILVPSTDKPAPPTVLRWLFNDQCLRARYYSTDQSTDLEDNHGHQEGPFEVIVFVNLSGRCLRSSKAHKVGRGIPRHIVETVKLVCDFADGCADDSLDDSCVGGVFGGVGIGRETLLTWSSAIRKTATIDAPARRISFKPCGYWSSLMCWTGFLGSVVSVAPKSFVVAALETGPGRIGVLTSHGRFLVMHIPHVKSGR